MKRSLLCVFLLSGCVPAEAPSKTSAIKPPSSDGRMLTEADKSPLSLDGGFVLDSAALADNLDRARRGDVEAAFKLSLHYLSIGNSDEREHWLMVAANGGHPGAQYTRWFDLRSRTDCASMQEAVRWLQSSADAGNKLAREELAEYKSLVGQCKP